ncbi:MAG TPA: hypothetical protein VNF71_11465 [Acidimicrobiales bacterium]|nr:hypothetical protein [Acidimicrobiales bacterium]
MTTTTERLRDACPQPARELSRCQCWGRDTVIAVEGACRNPQPGSARRFCSPACRRVTHRRQRAGATKDAPAQRSGGRGRRLRAVEEVTPLAK